MIHVEHYCAYSHLAALLSVTVELPEICTALGCGQRHRHGEAYYERDCNKQHFAVLWLGSGCRSCSHGPFEQGRGRLESLGGQRILAVFSRGLVVEGVGG